MKNRKAALQQKLDGAIKAYREHVTKDLPGDITAEDLQAHDEKSAELKKAMARAAAALNSENAALEAEALLVPAREGTDRSAEISGGEDRSRLDPRAGFNSIGEFVSAVIGAGRPGARSVDERLHFEAAAPTTYGNVNTGADGGYLVPPEFARQVYSHSLAEGSFLPLTDELPVSGNSITLPRDETTPWGTDGIRMYWQGEASAANQTKPKLGEASLKMRKIIGLVPLTDELAADALAAGSYCRKKLGEALAWKVNSAIVDGTGTGMPLGFRASSVIVAQAAEGSQTADTINAANVAKMLGRLPPASLASSKVRWLISNDSINQLPLMTIGQQPIWTPPQAGFKDAPMGYLLGRPIVVSQVCQTLGDAGDIQLVDFGQYVTISKGPEYAESMHLFFDADAMAIRLTFRMDGQPWMSAPVSPANGATTLSPFVQLAARA